jgi:uncharacterized protein
MLLLIILICSELLTIMVLWQHFKGSSKALFYISLVINSILSIYMWILFIEVSFYKGNFDNPKHVWRMLNLAGAFCAILAPRVLLDIFHFTGKMIRLRKGHHIRSLTNAGLIIWLVLLPVIVLGSTRWKYNFRTEEVVVRVQGLKKSLDGLTIVQISDLHLPGFYCHKRELIKAMKMVNSFKPDILINSGDFIDYGWREFDRSDTILSIAKGRLGNFAVIGNHDNGTYDPDYNESDRDTDLVRMNQLITASGYKVLNDENTIIKIGDARVAIIGVITKGRHLHIIYGDLIKARAGTDSTDFRILITHDPNHWEKAVKGKTNIELTLAGHTHGMQMGILTKRFKWSPAQYFYPRWNGLYSAGKQFLYVNRGLGVFAVPFRIWMPPEITVIKLAAN